MKSAKDIQKIKKSHLVILAAIVALLACTGAYFIFRQSEESIRLEKSDELKSISHLKIGQIVNWRKERIGDARVTTQLPVFINSIDKLKSGKYDTRGLKHLTQLMENIRSNYDYSNLSLLSADGEVLFSLDKLYTRPYPQEEESIKEALETGEIVISKLYRSAPQKEICLDMIAPLAANGKIKGLLLFTVSPRKYLFPLIQFWPTLSKTAETLIIRKDGNSVLFANEIRFRENAALFLRIPLTRKDVPAVQAVLGYSGIWEGRDYRDEEVLSYIKHIPGTPWYMIAKVDKSEIYSELYKRELWIGIFTSSLILLSTIGLFWLYHYRQRNLYRELVGAQEGFKATLYSIGDAVITTNSMGIVQNMNPVAETLTGWSEAEAINKSLNTVFNIINEETGEKADNPVKKVLENGLVVSLANHTVLISKDGREIPIADSGAPIKNEVNKTIGVILVFRDQTEERLNNKLKDIRLQLFSFAQDHSMTELLTKSLDEIEVLTKSEISFYHLVLPDQETIKFQAWSSNTENKFCKVSERGNHYNISDAGVWADCVREKRPVIHNDYNHLEGRKGLPEGHTDVIRELIVPVMRNDRVVAVLGIGNKSTDYDEKDIALAEYLADVSWEIADTIQKREIIRESQSKFSSLFTSMTEGVAMHELILDENNVPVDYRILDCNPAFEIHTGVPRSDVLGKNSREAYKVDAPPYFDIYKNVALSGRPASFESEFLPMHKYFKVSVFKTESNRFATIFEDITEQKRFERKIKESENFLRETQKIACLGTYSLNITSGAWESSEELDVVFGIGPDFDKSINGWLSIIHPEWQEAMKDYFINEVVGAKKKFSREYKIIKVNDKSERWVHGMGELILNAEGEPVKMIGSIQDITERKNAEEEILRLNRVYALLSNTNKVIIQIKGENDLFEKICRIAIDKGEFYVAWAGVINYGTNTLNIISSAGLEGGRPVLDYVELDDSANDNLPSVRAIKKKVPCIINNLAEEKIDDIIDSKDPCQSSVTFPLTVGGKVHGVLAIYSREKHFFKDLEMALLDEMAEDISFGLEYIKNENDRKLAERELKKLSRAVEQSPVSVVITDPLGNIEYVNRKFSDITGYSYPEVKGKNPNILNSGAQKREFYENMWNTILSGRDWKGEILNKKKSGELFWEYALISPLVNESGDITHFIAVKEDITERKRIMEELIRAKEQAEQSNKLKDAFIANMSHEIRTPLNGILGFTSLIKDTYYNIINEEDKELFRGIDSSGRRITRTIDLILNYSRLQVGEYSMDLKEMNIEVVCKHLLSEFKTAAEYKSISLSLEKLTENTSIFTDEYSATHAISNLIDNAIKYTKEGFVKITLYENHKKELLLDVHDSGIGMSEDFLEHIFEPYLQEQMGYGRAYEGVGLGLSLIKKFLNMINATISIKSAKGVGSTFTINFGKYLTPAGQEEKDTPEMAADEEPVHHSHKSVLFVEDDVINQTTVKKYFKKIYEILIANSSEEAVEILESNNVDLVLMDISIKGEKNGLELTKELKSSERFSKIPVIAVTAHAFETDRQNAFEAGCDDYLAKPFSLKDLHSKIKQLITV